MKQMLPKAEYLKTLPRKIVGAGALLRNQKGEILIVKPTYRAGWLVPGGGVDALESPMAGCLREIKEEIGLELESLDFLGVAYTLREDGESTYDTLQFTFSGGILSPKQIAQIALQDEELSEWKFAPVEEASALLSPALAVRIRDAAAILSGGSIRYSEFRS